MYWDEVAVASVCSLMRSLTMTSVDGIVQAVYIIDSDFNSLADVDW